MIIISKYLSTSYASTSLKKQKKITRKVSSKWLLAHENKENIMNLVMQKSLYWTGLKVFKPIFLQPNQPNNPVCFPTLPYPYVWKRL